MEKRLGGAVKVWFACSGGCGKNLQYASSQVWLKSHGRNCVSLAMARCFLVWGGGYPAYTKVLKVGLGMDVLSKNSFQRIIEMAYPHVKSILDRMCEKAKHVMKSIGIRGAWQLEANCYNIRRLLVNQRVSQSVLYFRYH